MYRTSIYLPKPLHYRLQIAAREAKMSVSNLLIEIADQELARREHDRLNKVYESFDAMREQIKLKGITSASIDDLLYGSGEQAAWRGNGTE
jgi:hypothetical protein